MSETIEISDEEPEEYTNASIQEFTDPLDLNDFNAMVEKQVESMKKQIDRQNILKNQEKRRVQLEEERLRNQIHNRLQCQREAEQQAFEDAEDWWNTYR